MLRQKQDRRLHGVLLRPLFYCLWLLPALLFVSCNELSSEDDNHPKITEVWVLQRVDISIRGEDGRQYSYSYTDKAQFDDEVQEEDTYPYYLDVFSPYAYVLFNNGRIETLGYSEDYEEFKKDPNSIYPLSSKNPEYYRIDGNKLYIRCIWHWDFDLGEFLAYYIKSNDKHSIVLEVYDQDTIHGYYDQIAPDYGEDSQYHYTASYKKERK